MPATNADRCARRAKKANSGTAEEAFKTNSRSALLFFVNWRECSGSVQETNAHGWHGVPHRHPIRSEQSCTVCRCQWAQAGDVFDTRRLVEEGMSMSTADQFRQYAEEAMRWAYQSSTEKNKQALIELARTWTQAAVQSDSTVVVNDNAPEHRAL